MRTLQSDMVIVGGGSAGFGAAIRAARENPQARIDIIETMDRMGGTSTVGGVNNWEPGIGGLGVHTELYNRLKRKGAAGVGKSIHMYSPQEPYGLSDIDPDAPYEQSLRRSGWSADQWRRVQFEPEAMASEMEAMLLEAGNVHIHYRTRLASVKTNGTRLESVIVDRLESGETYTIEAKMFIDSSGGVYLCTMAGCETAFGEDASSRFDEPSAPQSPRPVVNGVTLVYRVEKTDGSSRELDNYAESNLPENAVQWPLDKTRTAFITNYPNGDLCFNLLPVMEGKEFHELPYEEARAICEARCVAHWHWFKRTQRFINYRFQMVFPLVGIRESNRLVGRYVLVEQDIRAGITKQPYQEQIIAFADHSLDTHGQSNVKKPLNKNLDTPYGIPYHCLLPKEYDNLIAATRGASFSHIAASSCRLSRTMMALGEAAGIASALAIREGILLPNVSVAEIQKKLQIPEMLEKIKREW
jgi:hypothetical protein